MKKTLINLMAIIMLAIISVTSFACGGGTGNNPKFDASKSQIYIATDGGGPGTDWIFSVAHRFEEYYAEHSFEDGKTGVQIFVDADKDKYSRDTLTNSLSSLSQDIIISVSNTLFDKVSENSSLLLDITDAVTTPLTEFGETRSIADKMNEQQLNYYKQYGKFYGIPSYNVCTGIIYDVDLFDRNKLFFKPDGTIGAGLTDARSNGPDGNSVTEYDNGLPATYAQFFQLCDYMKNTLSIDPISWTGQYRDAYVPYLTDALWANYEGSEKAMLRYNVGSVDGKDIADIVTQTQVNGNGNVTLTTTPTKITIDNWTELAKQPGIYYSLDFIQKIIKNNYYSVNSMVNAQSHVLAQADFLLSSYESDHPIAMLIEGSWWSCEAKPTFDEMLDDYPDSSMSSRRFAFMPLPKANESKIGSENVLLGKGLADILVNGNVAKERVNLMKQFVRFINTDKELVNFTKETNVLRALNYEIKGEDYEALSYYAKSLIELQNNSTLLFTFYTSKEDYMSLNQKEPDFNYSSIDGTDYLVAVNAFRDGVTALDFFNGIYDYMT